MKIQDERRRMQITTNDITTNAMIKASKEYKLHFRSGAKLDVELVKLGRGVICTCLHGGRGVCQG